MEQLLEDLLKGTQDTLAWRDGDNGMRADQLTPTVVFFQLEGVLGPEAAGVIESAFERFVARDACVVFWDLSKLRDYSSELRDATLGALRKQSARIRIIHVHSPGAPWTVRMAINLANLVMKGRVETHDERPRFITALNEAVRA
jgi:hypothetical protein